MNVHTTDVVVVGAGAAGLITALNLARRRVTVLTPDCGEGSITASDLAQGGIAAALGRDDSPSLHLRDTLRAGCEPVVLPAARLLCAQAAGAVSYLDSLGIRFAHTADGWSQHTGDVHSHARMLHLGEATGRALMFGLRRAIAAAAHVDVMPATRAVRLLTNAQGVCGVIGMTEDGRPLTIRAHAVVIATGGLGSLFARSTNPQSACGDGVAMALVAGARCDALEFVQFYPTTLRIEGGPLPLLTDALRASGARLIDQDGRSLIAEEQSRSDRAPWSEVARAIYLAELEGREAFLDARHLRDPTTTLPSTQRACRRHGLDLGRDLIPITPAAHYFMGGIAVDLDGRTSLPGLWAVGEVACTGVHGANRLAGNSLLEAIVFGRRLGHALSRDRRVADGACETPGIDPACWPDEEEQRALRQAMWHCLGVVRSAASIAEGLGYIARLREQTPMAKEVDHGRLLLAQQMLLAAARRRTSCGAHFRADSLLFKLPASA